MKPLIILTGPTAVGKTELSIRLAKAVNGEIISADSMQVYKKMDIGTAKIRPEEMQGVKHYLIDCLEPDEDFNVVLFQKMAKDAMEKIYDAGHIPIIAGGTGFYIQALLYDINFDNVNEESEYRKYLKDMADKEGNDIRNGIYLPEGTWIDYFSGEKYEGNRILSNFDTPVWKLPVFVKNGAIIPMTQPNNNVSEIDPSLRIYEFYPNRHTATVEYDDDGVTEAYRQEKSVSTLIESNVDAKNRVTITIHPTAGSFDGFVKDKKTELRINVTEKPKKLTARINN